MNLIKKEDYFLLDEIVKKNFASKYKGSVLGILWSVLKPLLIMILLTIIFSTMFASKIENFPVYFLSGKILFDFFSISTSTASSSLKRNQNILQRTAAPKHVFVLGVIASEFLNFIITFIILILVMFATHAQIHITSIFIIIPLISLIMITTGVGLILSIFCVHYVDIEHLWTVAILFLTYASAIFYPMDIIPEPFYSYMILNPIYWIIDQFRIFIMQGAFPNMLNIVNSILLSLIILIVGIIIFKKYEARIAMKF